MIAAVNDPHRFDHASLSQLTRVNHWFWTRMGSLLRGCSGGWWPLTSCRGFDHMQIPCAAVEVKSSTVAKPEHLVVLVNGINGSVADWSYGAKQFEELGDKVHIHCSACNPAAKTFDGIDTMGLRLAKEVETVVSEHSSFIKISFVAHSLGGLVARYAIGKLYWSGRIAGLEPINFITIATPHLGSKGNKQLPFLCGVPFLERTASQVAHLIVRRSGRHLFLTDNDNGKPLLLTMVNDSNDFKFISALKVFKRRIAYANAYFDHMVGWRSSSIRRQRELPKQTLLVPLAKYPHIVYIEPDHHDCPDDDAQHELEEKMIRGLNQARWERVDVYFDKGWQRFIAHNTIQVKRYWLKDGADVIEHIKNKLKENEIDTEVELSHS